ncbi:hypothetical protein [Variovorax sp. W2I14]|uniref:hypothetical protein n=1 Tax=Variovorax sp. W2I14 TaxID=3042290 RepID=UPI003D1BA013
MNKLKKEKTMRVPAISIIAAIVLTACGGGGGGGGGSALPFALPATQTPAQPTTQPETPPPATNTLQTEAPAPTYSADSGELAAFKYLQSARSACGFGVLRQNVKLDAAALSHSRYLIAAGDETKTVTGHGEVDTANPFFTGNSPADRGAFAGYGQNVTEDLSAYTNLFSDKTQAQLPSPSERGAIAMRGLLNTVAHLSGVMSAGQEVGFGSDIKNYEAANGTFTSLRVDYRFGLLVGSQQGTQLLGAGNVATYPCATSVDLDFAFAPATEDPNPFPEITDPLVKVGPPIYIRADADAILKVNSFVLKDSAGEKITVRTDVGAIGKHEFFMVPSSPLQPGATYNVIFEGTANGKNFNKSFSFKTKAT